MGSSVGSIPSTVDSTLSSHVLCVNSPKKIENTSAICTKALRHGNVVPTINHKVVV